MFLFVTEILLAVIFGVFWFTQILIPMLSDEPIFPLFWSEEQKLRVRQKRAVQKLDEFRLSAEVNDLEEELKGKTEDKSKTESDNKENG